METNNKLRKALDDATGLLENILESFSRGTGGVYMSDVAEAIDNARAALAAPLRNCDVGTVDEQLDRFKKHCEENSQADDPDYCSSICDVDEECITHCALKWAQMPYEKGESK